MLHTVARSQSSNLLRSQVLTNFVLFINFGGDDQLLRLLAGQLIALLDLTLQQQTQPFRKRSDDALSCVQRGGHRIRLHGLRAHDLRGPNWCAGSDRHGRAPALVCTACPDSTRRAHNGATRAAPRQGRSLPSLPVLNRHEPAHPNSHTPSKPSHVVAGATFGAPGKTNAPSSSANCSCCYPASSCSSTYAYANDPLSHSCPTGHHWAEDIGDLEGYVRATGVMLFFLSKKYFGSRNCLKEIEASIEQKKPLVLVQEQQEDKGGGPLEILKAECRNDEMREAIFDGRTPI
eukprot:scaffold12062_cov79-Phaeocystis_antarctica.AAC.1